MNRRAWILAAALAVSSSTESLAQWCTARHAGTGQAVPVRERPGPSAFWAHAAFDPDGWPAITYGPTFFQLPPLMQKLTKYHECAHVAIPTTNEFQANCAALAQMRSEGLTKQLEGAIAQFHVNLGSLPPQYGGSGAAFWQGTINLCGP